MKKTLTHHDFYKLCTLLEGDKSLHSMLDSDLILVVKERVGLAVQSDQIKRAFEAIEVMRLTDPSILELAVRGLCIKTGLTFAELVALGRKSQKAQAEALEKLSKTSEQPLPLGDIDAAVNGGSPEGDGI